MKAESIYIEYIDVAGFICEYFLPNSEKIKQTIQKISGTGKEFFCGLYVAFVQYNERTG
jgi:hypothetical protein